MIDLRALIRKKTIDKRIVAASDDYFEGARALGIEFELPLSTTNTTNKTECMPKHIENGTCLTPNIVLNLQSYLVSRKGIVPKNNNAKEIVDHAIKATGCDAESCMLSQREVIDHLSKTLGDDAMHEIKTVSNKLKPIGPKDTTAWLANDHIDEVLNAWVDEYSDFYPYCFCMMDFAAPLDPSWHKGSIEEVRIKDLIEGKIGINGKPPRPFRRMACVLNTDVSTGRGKHWVCLFMNCPKDDQWTIEYFNSSGNPPTKEINSWVARVLPEFNAMDQKYGPKLGTKFVYYNVQHQRSRSECGMYCLFYIRARLNGVPVHTFNTKRVADGDMQNFRTHVFSKEDLVKVMDDVKHSWGIWC